MPWSIHTTNMPYPSEVCPVDTLFVDYLVDPDVGVEIFFKKEGAAKKEKLILGQWIEATLQASVGA